MLHCHSYRKSGLVECGSATAADDGRQCRRREIRGMTRLFQETANNRSELLCPGKHVLRSIAWQAWAPSLLPSLQHPQCTLHTTPSTSICPPPYSSGDPLSPPQPSFHHPPVAFIPVYFILLRPFRLRPNMLPEVLLSAWTTASRDGCRPASHPPFALPQRQAAPSLTHQGQTREQTLLSKPPAGLSIQPL